MSFFFAMKSVASSRSSCDPIVEPYGSSSVDGRGGRWITHTYELDVSQYLAHREAELSSRVAARVRFSRKIVYSHLRASHPVDHNPCARLENFCRAFDDILSSRVNDRIQ